MNATDLLNILSATVFTVVIALGLMIIFGVMRVINMAHGEFFMLGAYAMWLVASTGASPWLGILVAPLALAIVGVLVERGIIRPLHGRGDLSTLLATFGLSIALQQAVQLVFSPQSKGVASPISGSTSLLGTVYPTYRLVAIALGVVVIVAVGVLLYRSRFGVRVRATIENPEVAACMGTDVRRVYATTFALGAALAGLAGALMAPFIGVAPGMGLEYVVRSFLVVIVGGMGNIVGTLGGGALIGGGESALNVFTSGAVARVGVLLLAMTVILARPQGLFRR
jgi:branched-chain amino acid transport system permease protein/urea transport system permease protein